MKKQPKQYVSMRMDPAMIEALENLAWELNDRAASEGFKGANFNRSDVIRRMCEHGLANKITLFELEPA